MSAVLCGGEPHREAACLRARSSAAFSAWTDAAAQNELRFIETGLYDVLGTDSLFKSVHEAVRKVCTEEKKVVTAAARATSLC